MSLKSLFGIAAALLLSTPAGAHEWVSGTVNGLWDYAAYDPALGILITLGSVTWGSEATGSPANGLTQCTSRSRIAVGSQGVTSEIQMRMYSTLLTAQNTNTKVNLYVDTQTSAPFCAVQITMVGEPLP